MPVKSAAATFTVTTLDDNESNGCGTEQCTLREAIDDANDNTQPDTITFASGASNGTIVLTAGKMYVIAPTSKRGEFGEQKYVLNVVEDVEGLDFVTRDVNSFPPTKIKSSLFSR